MKDKRKPTHHRICIPTGTVGTRSDTQPLGPPGAVLAVFGQESPDSGLKGRKIPAQGNALGINELHISPAP